MTPERDVPTERSRRYSRYQRIETRLARAVNDGLIESYHLDVLDGFPSDGRQWVLIFGPRADHERRFSTRQVERWLDDEGVYA